MDKEEKLSTFAELLKQQPQEKTVEAQPINTTKMPERISEIIKEGGPCAAIDICGSVGRTCAHCENGLMPTPYLSFCIANLIIVTSAGMSCDDAE